MWAPFRMAGLHGSSSERVNHLVARFTTPWASSDGLGACLATAGAAAMGRFFSRARFGPQRFPVVGPQRPLAGCSLLFLVGEKQAVRELKEQRFSPHLRDARASHGTLV
ncbi:MAG: hypothetical protein ACLP9L_01255, partial [Thermoguttaceae bacterium]